MFQFPKINFSKKFLLSAAVSAFLLLVLLVSLAVLNTITVRTGFFQIPDNTRIALQEEISRQYRHVKFFVIDDATELKAKNIKKYNLFFTRNTKVLEEASGKSGELNNAFYSIIPGSLQEPSRELKAIPVLLDHYEAAFYRTYRNFSGRQIPENYASFVKYLQEMKSYADLPLFVAGNNDENLWGLVSAAAEATGLYDKIIQEFREKTDEGLTPSLEKTLNEIKALQKLNLLHPNWFRSNQKDLETMMQDHRIAVFCTNLSVHRTMPFVLIKYYDAGFFPPFDYSVPHGIISPCVYASNPSRSKKAIPIIVSLLEPEIQGNLSTRTGLAPGNSQAEAGDSLSSDVRFWAASCTKGAVPSLQHALFVSSTEQAKYAQYIRNFLAE